jgi:hypothetical protein
MTEEEAFQQLAVENLAAFGWTVAATDVADKASIDIVMNRLVTWYNSLSSDTRVLIAEFDLAPGLWNLGYLNEWPAIYNIIAGNPWGHFYDTLANLQDSLNNTQARAPEYAAQAAQRDFGHIADDPAFQGEQSQ